QGSSLHPYGLGAEVEIRRGAQRSRVRGDRERTSRVVANSGRRIVRRHSVLMMSSKINMHAKALALARQGLPVFPCRWVEKRPWTDNGFKDASTDPELVRRWWAQWPRAYIGVPTGDKFVVIDLDLQHVEALSWFETNRARLPLTRTHVTKSGGRHLLFKPNSKVGCTTSKLSPRIDTRGSADYDERHSVSGTRNKIQPHR